jgi:hypothetical protein
MTNNDTKVLLDRIKFLELDRDQYKAKTEQLSTELVELRKIHRGLREQLDELARYSRTRMLIPTDII